MTNMCTGQWGPIVGTGLAVIGSLYLLLEAYIEAVKEGTKVEGGSIHHCNCSHHHVSGDHISPVQSSIYVPRPGADVRSQPSIDGTAIDDSTPNDNGMQLAPTISRPYGDHHHELTRNTTVNDGNRRRVAESFIKFGNVLGTAARDLLDDSEFKSGRALDFPEVPGEIQRNAKLTQIRSAYNQRRDSAGNPTSLPRSRSRSGSFPSDHSGNGLEDSPTPRRGGSPRPSGSSFTSPTMPPRSYTGSVQMSRTISEPHRMISDSGPPRATPMRLSTLEVPSRSHRGHRHTQSASSEMPIASTSRGIAQSPLGITTTIEDDVSSSSRTPSFVFPATPTSPDAGPSASR